MVRLRLLFGVFLGICSRAALAGEVSNAVPEHATTLRELGTNGPVIWTIGEQGEHGLSIDVHWPGCKVRSVPEGVVFAVPERVAGPGDGNPDLPRFARVIPGRAHYRASLRLQANPEWVTVREIGVAPAESMRPTFATSEVVWVKSRDADASVYQRDEFWPPSPWKVTEVWMGTQKLVRVECCLLQYNPVRKELRFATDLKGEVVFEASEGR